MQSRWTSIYRFPNHLIVCPESQTTAGMKVAVEPFQVLPIPVSPTELGAAIQRALAESRWDIPQPADWKKLASPRLAAAGVKTEAAFQKKSQLVSAEFNGAVLKFVPYRNGGGTGMTKGFEAAVEHERMVKEMSSEALGTAAFLTFESCA